MKSLFAIVLFIACLPLSGQVGSFDEMEIESDSARSAYKPSGKNYVFTKSKRGTAGMTKTPNVDAILSSEVSEIVLVFSETDPSSIADREESIRERWENLLLTYPELFQFSTTYKNFCQCNSAGDPEAFKLTAGFYIFVNGEVPKSEEPVAVTTAPVTPVEAKKPVEEKKPAEVAAPKAAPAPAAAAPAKEVAPVDNTSVKSNAPAAAVAEPVAPKEVAKEAAVTSNEEPEAPAKEVVKAPKKKKIDSMKPRKAKDKKACRPACYGWGDEDLIAFFKDNITLTRKQKRKAKNWVANVKLQIHFDGVIKKDMVTGSNETFNSQVSDVIKRMNKWNAAVKNGVAVKSEIKFTLKYDKATKSIRPYDIISNPKPSSKCPCVSDGEIFGSGD